MKRSPPIGGNDFIYIVVCSLLFSFRLNKFNLHFPIPDFFIQGFTGYSLNLLNHDLELSMSYDKNSHHNNLSD